MPRRHDEAGTTIVALAAVILIVGTFCGTVMLRSLESYRAAAVTEQRLQERAAAEGAVVALLRSHAVQLQDLEIGDCRVMFGEAQVEDETATVSFRVDLTPRKGLIVRSSRYQAQFKIFPDMRWTFLALEEE
jgi:hypothetical protein